MIFDKFFHYFCYFFIFLCEILAISHKKEYTKEVVL